jgi:hypothetical protein
MYMLIDLVIGVCGTLLLHLRFFEHTAARTNPAPHAVRWQYSAGTTVLCFQKGTTTMSQKHTTTLLLLVQMAIPATHRIKTKSCKVLVYPAATPLMPVNSSTNKNGSQVCPAVM